MGMSHVRINCATLAKITAGKSHTFSTGKTIYGEKD